MNNSNKIIYNNPFLINGLKCKIYPREQIIKK